MGFAEKRGDYYRARYKQADGKYGTVKDADGETIRYRTERAAKIAANDAEAAVRAQAKEQKAAAREPAPVPTFGQYVNKWWKRQALAASSMENYLDHIEGHLLPYFAEKPLDEIARTDVDAWELEEKQAGYATSSVQTYRSVLHLILQDAIDEGDLQGANPAAKRRNRGRRSGGGQRNRGPEKAITTPLGAMLIAERASLMSGRDDEFVQAVMIAWTGFRWSESIGLDRRHVRERALRVEHQLYELRRKGVFVHQPPKDDSYRTVDIPQWLYALLAGQIRRSGGEACACHGVRAVFTSMREDAPLTRAQIAAAAGVGAATVSRVLNDSAVPVAEATRARVLDAVETLRAKSDGAVRPHWKHNDFTAAVWTPAVTGWHPERGKRAPAHPVAVVDAEEAWPGRVLHGRYSATKASTSWLPIVRHLTPHGLRHAHRTWMEELGTPKVLMDDRMGHIDGSVSALYAHVTDSMRGRLVDGLTRLWEEALTERLALSPRSPVGVLDELLQAHRSMIVSQNSPQGPIPPNAA